MLLILALPKPTNSNLLSVIQYNYIHRNRVVPYPIVVDAEAAKLLCIGFCKSSEKLNELEGYVQDISYNPFGIEMVSEIQVRC